MIKEISISLPPEAATEGTAIRKGIAAECGVSASRIHGYTILRASLDARARRDIKRVLRVLAAIDEPMPQIPPFDPGLKDVHAAPSVVIAGAGPAGLFAALKFIEQGKKPIVLERGKDVRSRRRDLAAMNKDGTTNPESNYCFGEGGAGTYSDGKLYTRSTKRGDVLRILQLFVHFGASPEILTEAHPHIGTNKLPQIITAMRQAIIACGGELRFDAKLTDILIENDAVKGVALADGSVISCRQLVLATGHSARDVFELLRRKAILIEAKPFALGVRIEHPQALIDEIQYHCTTRSEHLPPASYSLVTQQQSRGVFSFCMCPGGIIAPAATAPGEIVVNGWSPSKRNNPFANSGTVVTVGEEDFSKAGFTGPLAGLHYQSMVERAAYTAGGGALVAPAQRMTDFVSGKASSTLPDCSYLPGIAPARIQDIIPQVAHTALRGAVQEWGKKMRGYLTAEAVLVATESRTSAPVRIPRSKETLQHPQISGLFPCGEGAGYAGGIVSAAIDGERCAVAAINAMASF